MTLFVRPLHGLLLLLPLAGTLLASQNDSILIRASRLIDGRGETFTDRTIEVRGSKIVAIEGKSFRHREAEARRQPASSEGCRSNRVTLRPVEGSSGAAQASAVGA